MIGFFHDVLYVPIYNLLVYLTGVLPGGDAGLAVVAVTLVVKVVTLPLTVAAIRTQKAMKAIEPEFKELREKYKDDKETQAREMFALYKKHNVKPFASILAILIQIPVLIALFWVFQNESLSQVAVPLLYSFVPVPEVISTMFLGLLPVAGASITLAIIAAITQFAHAYVAIPVPPKPTGSAPATMQEEFGRAMALQMRFMLPLIIGFVAFTSGAIALYFITSNLFTLLQELLISRKIRNAPVEPVAD
ncbi:YidC/Oxa1 family membrane protein insertase [Patescibacteria group bacterium]|nr:YidC/Oxa1 family membrane protein insertase [Patescibacteria group bacterium]